MVATKICASWQNLKKASVFKCNAQDPQPAPTQLEKPVRQQQPTDECQECGDAHKTEECPILLAMPMEECSKHISRRHLCYRCLQPDHVRRQWKSEVECAVSKAKCTTHSSMGETRTNSDITRRLLLPQRRIHLPQLPLQHRFSDY